MTVYCATGNPGKLREFRLAAEVAGIEVETVPGLADLEACEETGETFEANAVLKARYYGAHAPGLLFADDSGLEVDALGGAPGVYSARFAGPDATDERNNRLLLEKMRGVADRTARFVCVLRWPTVHVFCARFAAWWRAGSWTRLAGRTDSATIRFSFTRLSAARSARRSPRASLP